MNILKKSDYLTNNTLYVKKINDSNKKYLGKLKGTFLFD